MGDTLKLRFRCPYPTRSDDSRAAVRGFGPPPQDPDDYPGGRCDNEDTWEADGLVFEKVDDDGKPVAYIRVTGSAGNCPMCGGPGALDTKLPKTLRTATVLLS